MVKSRNCAAFREKRGRSMTSCETPRTTRQCSWFEDIFAPIHSQARRGLSGREKGSFPEAKTSWTASFTQRTEPDPRSGPARNGCVEAKPAGGLGR
jgi:hypothetical protein